MVILTAFLIAVYMAAVVAYAYFAPAVATKAKAKAKAAQAGVIEMLFVRNFRICERRFPYAPRRVIKAPVVKMTHVAFRPGEGVGPKVQTFEQPTPKDVVIEADVRIVLDSPFLAVCTVQFCTMFKLTPPARRIVTIVKDQVTESFAR